MNSILPFGANSRSICQPFQIRLGFATLLTLFLFSLNAVAQNDTPCECSQRWTEGAAWNANGTVNEDPPPMNQPNGIIKCSSTPGIQSNIMTQFGCVYNPATFPIAVMNCTDPITGLPIPSPNLPNLGESIIILNFDVRPNVGTFQIQINENNMMDKLGWALYYSASPSTSSGTAPQYQSGDCNNLIFYTCGEASNNIWQTFFTPNFSQATNFYLAVWDQDDDFDLEIASFQARNGCGNGDLYCTLETGAAMTTCHPDGTYTVNIPISGQNGNYVGTDPNALNSPSAAVCLTNEGDGGPTMGIISLTYPYGTAYNIDIAIETGGPCPDPLLPTACSANVAGAAPDCCTIPPSCIISGPANVCPNQTGIVFSGPAGMDSYQWTIMGNGTIVGSTTAQTVTVDAAGVCGGGFSLSLAVEQFTCVNQCMVNVTVSDPTPPTVTCPAPISLTACPSQLTNSFNTWIAGFSALDNCGPPSTTGLAGATPPSICGGTTTINFTAIDDCNNMASCSSTFTVAPAPAVVLTCPANSVEAACQTQAAITNKYNDWLNDATFSGGCNAVLSYNNPGAPAACGGTATITFTVASNCEADVTCTRTFTVNASPVVLTCPGNPTEAACQTQAEIDVKYAAWLATVVASGGCNGSLSNNSTGAPSACGGSKTVTFTYSSSCAPITTICQATFTVTAPATVVLTCPTDQVEASCQTQTAIDTKYNAWLASVSASGGCGAVLTNNSTGPPSACGGSKTVTFTYTSNCAPLTTSCTAIFTVNAPAAAAVLSCPSNQTEVACQTQPAIDMKYNAWLASVSASGGCGGILTSNSTGAPSACGGSKTVTFTFSSNCPTQTMSCTATFTVDAPAPIVLNCPANQTETACQSQMAIDAKFSAWIASVSGSGGCTGTFSNNSTGAPNVCTGGTSTVTFTYTSSCAPFTISCTAFFTVAAPPAIVLTCPTNVTEAACQSQSAIDAKFAAWLATASASGSCNGSLSNNSTTAPDVCTGGTATVIFSYANSCSTTPTTCTATFTVTAPTNVSLICPANVTESACQTQAAIDAKFATWLATVSASGGCNAMLTNNNTGAPDVCVGGTSTVTFTYISSCAPLTTTCMATFTVEAPLGVVLTCPMDVLEGPCQTQATIDTKYANWLATVSVTNPCLGVLTNNSTGAPLACGGSKTVIFTYSSSCVAQTTTCQATFSVTASPAVSLTCPANTSVASCQTQTAVDNAYAAWLTTVSASGGCNGAITNNSTGAPSACGGSKTVTFTYTSDCAPLTTTCQATFTVDAPPTVVLNCPVNTTVAACQTQADIDVAYAIWLASASAMGGCNGVLTNNSTGAPLACGGSKTVTFTYASSCAPLTTTCQATFTVTSASTVVLNCPVNTTAAACQTQADIDVAYANWLASASATGGCNGVLTNNSTGAPLACGGSATVTFTYTSSCAPLTSTCQATFTVPTATLVALNCPTDVTEVACQSQATIDTKYNNWLALATATGGCNTVVGNNSTGAPNACGGSVTVIFTANSSCEAPVTCTRTFSVNAAPAVTLNCPAPMVIPPFQTQAQIDAAFASWLATANASGGCNGVLTNNNTGAPTECGGTATVTFTYASSCAPFSTTCDQTFTVQALPPGVQAAKYFAGIDYATSGTVGNFDVITEIIVQNTGSSDLNSLSLVDNLASASNLGSAFVAVTGAPQIVAVGAKGATTTAATIPATNPAFNGTGDLLAGGGLLKPNQRYVLQFRFEVNPDAPGAPAVMKNQAQALGTVATCFPPVVINDLSDAGDNPLTTNPGWVSDSGGSNDPTLLTDCWNQLNNGIGCNDLLQVSLNQNCEIWLTPGMVLEGEIPMCINPNSMPLGSYYEVFMVTDAWGAPVPDLNPATANIHEISGGYIGQYLTVKIQDKVYKNSCWGQIFIEDKMAPVFTCPSTPTSVFCTANLANVPPPVAIDNCDPNPVITLVGNQVIDNNICDDGIYTVRRTYKATDNQGNTSVVNCIQNINITRPPVDFPDDITWSCTQYSAHSNIVNPTKLHPTIVDVDLVELGIDVSPTLPDTTLSNTGSGVVNVSVSTICAYNVLHADQILNVCGTSFKIQRTWTVVDWCTGDIIITGVGGEDNVQIIKIADKVGPTITRTPFNVSINVPAVHPQPCKSTGILLPPTVGDNCNAVTVQIITTIGEAIYINGVDGTNGGTIPAPGLGIGTHQVTYIATDACGNSTTIIVPVTVKDDITPTAICMGFTEVDLPSGVNPTATVVASVFNTGSTDNCCLHHFEVRRMEDPCNDGHDDTVFGPSVVFCCEDVSNNSIMVVFRAYDCFGNYNDCMVSVDVNDKQPPVLITCPPNQRITCDFYVDNFETQLAALGNQTAKSQFLDANFGQPVFADNCTSMTVTRTFASNLTQCKEGTMTRTWKAADAQGQESGICTQTIFVDHVSDFVVQFPADITVTCGQSLPNFGEPTVFYKTCEMVAISYDDGLYEVVPGACYKFIRTWEVINWCVQGAIKDQEVTEVPESLLGLPFPQCDLDGDGDCDARTFRDSWTATQKPTANQANQQFGPDTDPDSDPWDGFITYDQIIMVIDNVAPVFVSCQVPDVCIQDSVVCAATFTLPQPTVMDCSGQVTITANTPGLGVGFGPFTHGPGIFITTFTANDGCNNQAICTDTFEVKDCKAPNISCVNGLIVGIMDVVPPTVTVNASALNAGTTDNCSGVILASFSPNVNDATNTFTCDDIGVNVVEIWFTDESGNQDFCVNTIEIQDGLGVCPANPLIVDLGGQIFNENNTPVGNVTVSLNGQNTPVMTGATGSFYFPTVSIGQDVTLVPNKDDNPLAGVTTYDIVLMSKHILNTELLNSPYKMIAADINNSKSITTFDLVELRKLILHINSNFPSNSSWRFVDKDYVFPMPTNPWFEVFPEIININDLPAAVLDADFVGVKIGDLNASYSFVDDENEERGNGTLIFATQNQLVEAGQTCSLSFRAKDFEAVGYQFTLDFDTDLLEFVEVGDGQATTSNFGFTNLEDGAISASWNQHGERNDELADFTLVFRAKTKLNPSGAIWLSDRFTRSEAYDSDGELLDIRLQFTDNELVTDFELFQNRPNPFSKETVIGFRLPESGKAMVTITDATGKVVKSLVAPCGKGYNEFRLNREELGIGTGILYYRLTSGTETATKMMLLTE
ncbi:MAG: hypothetical protein K9J37_04680 [Saprospiraceae bacterium]|nr:hypothetical protein [Saprospiraceae bacterium]MCF8249182.1 hypothetical protein [Saprospiraceae bacterium]MCF8281826.1 hypothetical protein [Bacteroidales bacterium]MCF8311311.1 hypothetical protein [Saprospiraceae bacterium]MCF8440125.1 hypothetical protein [Saprospiraceae bacterium]